jgi:excisionase family DNA binding protein
MESLTLTVDETARLLRISRNTAYNLAREGKLPVLRLGRRLLVSRKGLDDLLSGKLNQEVHPQ